MSGVTTITAGDVMRMLRMSNRSPITVSAASGGGKPCAMGMSGRDGAPGVADLVKLISAHHIDPDIFAITPSVWRWQKCGLYRLGLVGDRPNLLAWR